MKRSRLIAVTAFVVGVSILPDAGSAQSMTTEDIVARCAEAMGGTIGIDALRNLRFQTHPPDVAQPILWEIERPNLIRKEILGAVTLVFDGHRVAFMKGPPREDGTFEGPHLVEQEDWHHFEMDIALYVPAFFEYPARFVETTLVGENLAYLLHVDLPMGGVVVYAVDAQSFLPVKVMLPDWDLARYLGDYKEVGGIIYFHKYWTGTDPEDSVVLDNLEVNVAIERSRFTIPAIVR